MMNFFQGANSPPRGNDQEAAISNRKLNDLTMEERESGMQDLHGVSDIIQETQSLVQNSINSVRNELNLSDSIITDDLELLKFLRAENFDPKKAAARFNRFLAFRSNLFGKQGKGRASELDKDDAKLLKSGFMQLLPQKDRAGRAIIVCIGAIKQQMRTSLESDLRCLSVLALKAAEDEDIQKRGIVMVYYALGQKSYDGRNNRPVQLIVRAFEELPVRFVATHFCYDNEAMKPLLNLLQTHMERKMLCRFRSHCGHHAECQYSLMTFGIPKEALPVDATGAVDLTSHLLLLQSIKQQDRNAAVAKGQASSSPPEKLGSNLKNEKLLIPGHLDIILGRGQHAKNTPGHVRFKQLLDANKVHYEAAEKSQKTRVAEFILGELKAAGCRFLKPRAEGGWVAVSDEDGKEKINHAFRNLRNSLRKKAAASSTTSSPVGQMSSGSRLLGKRSLQEALESGSYPFHQGPSDLSDAKFFPL